MITDLKPYAEYRDSTAPWFGVVPAHWDVKRLGSVFAERGETNEHREVTEILSVLKQRGVIPYSEKGRIGNKASDDIRRYKIVRPDDLVVNCMNVIIGSLGRSRYTGCLSPVYYVLRRRNPKDDPRYLELLFQHKSFHASLIRIGNGILAHRMRIPMEKLKSEMLPLPPPGEQAAIVRFLDWANGRLDRAIRAKRKVIALLNEQKQAIIHRAVTRGLDPSVPLKESGVPWLGEIPAHWEVRKLKYEVSFTGGGTPNKANSAYWGGTIPWVSPKDMKSDVIRDAADHITEQAVTESSTNLVPPGSLLMVVRSGILQRSLPVARCDREVALNQDMKALISKGLIDLDYFVLLIRGCEKRLLQVWTKQGATVESVEHQFLANTRVPLPPFDEQRLIVESMEVETAPLTNAISRLEREITLLLEYRTRLVADVVTGKLDVREAAVRLPNEELLPDLVAAGDEADDLLIEEEDDG